MTGVERRRCFFIWVFLGVVPLFMRPLWEPDEARYGEIPREMLALGDWLTPRLNYVLYFEKPPLQYWMSAACMRLFGLHAWAARLPLALASLLALGCAWQLARRLGAREPVWAVFMGATALLAYVGGQILTLDALFSAFMLLTLVATLEAITAREEGKPHLAWTLGAFAAMALATLTKGIAAPVLVGGTFLASLPWAWRTPTLRRALLGTLFHPLGWALYALVAAPWFILVERAHPGHAWFFFIHEHFARYFTHVHDRAGSKNPVMDKLYFAFFLVVGLLPWAGAGLRGARRAFAFLKLKRGPLSPRLPLHRWTVAVVLSGALVPLVFFSLSGSKLPFYILPCFAPIAALACAFEREGERPATWRRAGWELLGLGLALLLATPFLLKEPSALPWALATGGALALTGLWALRPRGLTEPRFMAALAASLLLLTFAAQKAPHGDVTRLVAEAPRDAQWICFGNTFQGLPYLTGRRAIVVAGTGELAYGRDHLAPAERDHWFREDPLDLPTVARGLAAGSPAPVYALMDPGSWRDLPETRKEGWRILDRDGSCLLARFIPAP
jgi:4-amino-4-deoxy-L-arabinose transferase-like glycosyltransferase